MAGEGAAEGVIGPAPCSFFGYDAKNMDIVVSSAEEYSPGIPVDERTIRTVQAWGDALILWEALKRVDKKGIDLTSETSREDIVKEGFETLRDFDIGLGAPGITFISTDHRPTLSVTVYEWKEGKFHLLKTITPNYLSYVSQDGFCGGKKPCYQTLQEAIENAGTMGEVFLCKGTYRESLTLNQKKFLSLKGGWDQDFVVQDSETILLAAPTVNQGSLTMQNLRIKPENK